MPTDFLAEIVARKRAEVARRAQWERWLQRMERAYESVLAPSSVPLQMPSQMVSSTGGGAGAAVAAPDALRRSAGQLPHVIAEVKFRSPSKGLLHERAVGEAVRVARAYEQGGASAISVLADRRGFDGSVLDVRRVASAVTRPVLFKEFVLDEVQVRFAKLAGASWVLLIVRALDPRELVSLVQACTTRGLQPVVEAADDAELDRALDCGATIVGVNARDLRNFTVRPRDALGLVDRIPSSNVAVYMSGIHSREDFWRLRDHRADAVLVGESLMRAPRPDEVLQAWLHAT
jgi:indole-3-glycerol phosphate synthase